MWRQPMPGNKKPPCGKNCPNRKPGCQANCGKYIKFREELDDVIEIKNAENERNQAWYNARYARKPKRKR